VRTKSRRLVEYILQVQERPVHAVSLAMRAFTYLSLLDFESVEAESDHEEEDNGDEESEGETTATKAATYTDFSNAGVEESVAKMGGGTASSKALPYDLGLKSPYIRYDYVENERRFQPLQFYFLLTVAPKECFFPAISKHRLELWIGMASRIALRVTSSTAPH
jgi:hypothetical protein